VTASLPAPAPRSGNRRRRHYGYAVVVSILAILAQYYMFLPVFRDRLQDYLGIGDARFGTLFALAPLAGAAAIFASGPLLARLGPVRLLRLSLWGVAAGLLLLALAGRHWLLVLTGITVCGMAGGPLIIAMNAYLVKLFPRDRRRTLSFSLAIMSIGGMILPLLAELLLALPGRWPAVHFAHVLHLPCLLLALLLAAAGFLYRSRPTAAATVRPHRHEAAWNWRQFLLPWAVSWLVLLLVLHSAVDVAIYTWIPRFLDSPGLTRPLAASGLVLSAMSVAYVVSRGILSRLPEAWGRRRLLLLPGLLGGSLFVAGVLTRDAWFAAAGYVLGAFLWSAEYPALLGTLADRSQRGFGTAMALQQLLTGPLLAFLVFGMGQWTAWAGPERMGPGMAALGGGFLLVSAGAALWVLRNHPRVPTQNA